MKHNVQVEVAGFQLSLPLQTVDEDRLLPVFVGFNDVDLTTECASQLLSQVPDFDVVLTEEVQGVPLAFEMSRQAKKARFIMARKQAKTYMADVAAIQMEVEDEGQIFYPRRYLSQEDAEYLKGKRVLLVDDMVIAGKTIKVLEGLATALGAYVVGKAAILAHEGVELGEDIVVLAQLPSYHADDIHD